MPLDLTNILPSLQQNQTGTLGDYLKRGQSLIDDQQKRRDQQAKQQREQMINQTLQQFGGDAEKAIRHLQPLDYHAAMDLQDDLTKRRTAMVNMRQTELENDVLQGRLTKERADLERDAMRDRNEAAYIALAKKDMPEADALFLALVGPEKAQEFKLKASAQKTADFNADTNYFNADTSRMNAETTRYQAENPQARGGGTSDYAQFLNRYAQGIGKTIEQLTSADELKARKEFGRADDAAIRALAPIVIQTGSGPQILDRVSGTTRAVTGPAGQTVGPAPTTDMRNREAGRKSAEVVLSSISELSERINTGRGAMAKVSGMVERAKAQANLNDDLSEYQAVVAGFTPLLARALGHTGVLTEQDVQSVRNMLPRPEDSKSVRDRKIARIDTIMSEMPGGSASGGGASSSQPASDRVKSLLSSQKPGEYELSDGHTYRKSSDGSVSVVK